jgi:small-conductance mechanosensitive channel
VYLLNARDSKLLQLRYDSSMRIALPFLLLALSARAADPGTPADASAPASAASSTRSLHAPKAAASSAAAPLTGQQVIQLLDQTIDWYRTLGIEQQAANQPSDLLILYDNRQAANHVLSLAFDIGRTDADLLAKQPQTPSASTQDTGKKSLSDLQDKFSKQAADTQAELQEDQRALAGASAKQAVELRAKVAELQGELDLVNARKNLLDTMLSIANDSSANGLSASSLKAQIDAMAISMPAANGAPAPATPTAAPATAGAQAAAPPAPLAGASVNVAARFGIWDLAANVFKLSEKIATIKALDRRTAELQDVFAGVRDPLVARLKALSAQGDALATQADTADTATLNQTRQQLDALADQFKAAAALLVPLGKEGVLLNQYRRNLSNWRGIVASQYNDALKTLGVRVGVLAALLVLVFAAAELWRRAVMRYVKDARRRYQLMLLRRIALWTLVVVIVGLAFASELSSVVTFAGLITAGLAVAMQSVLVSIVGYFFLIGKYGIRVGDRVQIGEVTGEVIELGLVRLHLMELGNHGLAGPTGRVVAFANSIVFQVSSGLFKQIPGVNFTWHELTLNLPSGIDYTTTKEKLMSAVTAALKDSREEIVRQTREIQRTTASSSASDSQPRVQLNFSPSGVEAKVRYPVHLSDAAEIDERVSHELLNALNQLSVQQDAARK